MSYHNPEIPIDTNLIGLDAAIAALQTDLKVLPWLQKSFGRARLMPENADKGALIVPKVYQGKGEYYSVLPNDNLAAYSFVQVLDPEKFTNYDQYNPGNGMTARVGVVFYVNLKKVLPEPDASFTGGLKNEILQVLKEHSSLQLERIYDEKVRDIFEGYSATSIPEQYLYYPYAAIKFTGTLYYSEECTL